MGGPPSETPAEVAEAPAEIPAEVAEAPTKTSAEVAEVPTKTSAEVAEAPAEPQAEVAEMPTETPEEVAEVPTESPADVVEFGVVEVSFYSTQYILPEFSEKGKLVRSVEESEIAKWNHILEFGMIKILSLSPLFVSIIKMNKHCGICSFKCFGVEGKNVRKKWGKNF